ncbi:MAG: hypothetical protein NW216_12655 [Hyphomicrobium sp.]|nr:hypothetical protein [Hyphomicrobium sp.]
MRSIRAFLVLALAAGTVLPADAGWRNRGYNGVEEGYVIAHSRHGNGSITGPVREARHGLEVRLPGGTWVGCRASCSETLRVETVDIWENDGRMVGAGTAANECGIFGCLDVGAAFRE